jgi:isoleucyl-tRNA synthetase
MKALGPGFGKNSPRVKALIEGTDGNFLKAQTDAGRTVKLRDGNTEYEIGPQHVTFTEKLPAEVFSAPMQDATVYVDVRLDEDLEKEGYEREVIRRIQEMRKHLDLVVSEFISVDVLINNTRVYGLLNKNSKHNIAGEVLAVVPDKGVLFSFLKPGDKLRTHDAIKDWEIEGATETIGVTIGISRAGN